MTLTLIIENIPAHQRAAALRYGKVDGQLVTIEAADLFREHPEKVSGSGSVNLTERMRPPEPIHDDTSPEIERRRARQGGCCGKPTASAE